MPVEYKCDGDHITPSRSPSESPTGNFRGGLKLTLTPTRRAPYAKGCCRWEPQRLSLGLLRCRKLSIIGRHTSGTPSNLNGVGATKSLRAFADDRNDRDEC